MRWIRSISLLLVLAFAAAPAIHQFEHIDVECDRHDSTTAQNDPGERLPLDPSDSSDESHTPCDICLVLASSSLPTVETSRFGDHQLTCVRPMGPTQLPQIAQSLRIDCARAPPFMRHYDV